LGANDAAVVGARSGACSGRDTSLTYTHRGYILSAMSDTVTYTVPGMSCEHCRAAVTEEVSAVTGVETVDVDLETKLVTVRGTDLDDSRLRDAIEEAGYAAA
jgi:copper chaperone